MDRQAIDQQWLSVEPKKAISPSVNELKGQRQLSRTNPKHWEIKFFSGWTMSEYDIDKAEREGGKGIDKEGEISLFLY